MKVLVTTLVRNEERIIPYFIHHYSDIADKIVLIDHESTDQTVQTALRVAEDTGVDLEVFTMRNDGYDEVMLKNVKEGAYHKFKDNFDIVIVVDADEFLHHPDGTRSRLREVHDSNKEFVIKPTGYQMVSKTFPVYSGSKLTDLITEGTYSEGFSKKCCFTADLQLRIAFGMHLSEHYNQNNELVESMDNLGFMMLHYKLIDLEYRIERIRDTRENLSQLGRDMLSQGISKQIGFERERLEEEYNNQYDQRKTLKL
tara:strand:+ start:30 stop:797 length:768 start_codon:yes stop_codon:yes gene_type:complete